ncbi:MAG: hypothetical protein K0S71_1034 [Clostridia bacterium]|jgi:hypothetical protein|nr:hypothetical protein [Clostridia bacterium]
MHLHQTLKCPKCQGENFTAKYESTYVYSYKIDLPETDRSNTADDPVPYLFDNREQKGSTQYIECDHCKTKFPCEFTMDSKDVDFTIVQKAIRGNYVEDIGFWG